jgi:hypothetical protein
MSSFELTELEAYYLLKEEDRKEKEMVQSSIAGASQRQWRR